MNEEFNEDIEVVEDNVDIDDSPIENDDCSSDVEPDFEDEEWERLREISVTGPDGEDIPLYDGDIRENTVELVGHNEYEDAQLTIELDEAERRKEIADKMQSGDYADADLLGPINDMDEIRYQKAIDEGETEAVRKAKKWSVCPYTEEYKP